MLINVSKAFFGAVLGGILGFLLLFAFTAITNIWFVILDLLLGVAVAGGIILFNKESCRENLMFFRIVGSAISLFTVILAEYEINRFVFVRSGRIEASDFAIIPSSLDMFLNVVITNVWWQPIVGAVLAVIAVWYFLGDWAD